MKKLLRNSVIFILMVTLFGCGINNQAQDRQGDRILSTERSGQLPLANQNESHTSRIESNPNTRGKDNGLSEEYHGHIQNRPIKQEAKIRTEEQRKDTDAKNRYISVQLLGINDLHGQLNVTRKVNGKPVGRADYLATYLKEREATNKNTLLVQAGDMVGASPPISALMQDEPTIEILNQLGFDIGTIGNHEFDEGYKELLRLIHGGPHELTGPFAGSNFPWIAANVIDEKTGKSMLPPHQVIRVNGMPIGFIGVVYSDTPEIVIPSGVAGLKFTDEAEAINRSVAELKKQGVRAIVVLAHNPGVSGVNGETPTGELVEIANKIDDEVDIIFGGHNHAYMNSVVDNKLLVQSYSFGTAFSDVDLLIDPKTKDIVSKKAEIITTFQEGMTPDPQIKGTIDKYEARIEPIVNRVIGDTSVSLTAKQDENGESVLGNLIADSQRASMKTDFAFMNPGGIRADIDQGQITWGELYTVQPFNNDLVKMVLTGKQIRELLNQQWDQTSRRMLQISGLTYTWDDNRPVGDKIVNIFNPDGSELMMDKTYTVTVNSFLAGGGDKFTVLIQGTDRVVGKVDIDALVDYIKTLPSPFTYKLEGRIQKLQY